MSATPEISVVIPFYNEAELAESVTEEVLQVLTNLGRAFEIVLIDDGSSDGTLDVLMRAQARSRCCRLVRHPRNVGQSAALWHGLHMARGAILITLDGDGQNDPADLPALLEQLDGADMVVGIRADRHDPWLRSAMSRIANGVRRRWLGDGVSDSGCALKVFRRQALDSFLPIRSLYSFIPAFAVSAGLRVREYPVRHRARRAGEPKYGLRVMLWRPFVDMMAIGWITHRRFPLVEVQEIVPDTKSEDR